MKNAFTVDYEDWYHSLGLPQDQWEQCEDRIHIGHEKILTLLQKHKVKASFYIVGDVIAKHPDLIKEIIEEGHEIGCHTYTHRALYDMTPAELDEELNKCSEVLSRISPVPFTGFRAPMWSIDQKSLWALDIIRNHGYQYDSSIYPGDNKRTGIQGYRKDIHHLKNGLVEVPCCIFPFLQFEVGVGGAYFRILPYIVTQKALQKINKSGQSGMFYMHPWELDPKHPKIQGISKRIRIPHYFNLKNTEKRIDRLLSEFDFTRLDQIISDQNIHPSEYTKNTL